MAARRVCWRGDKADEPLESSSRRAGSAVVNRSKRAGGGSRRIRAAANSIARGKPSRRRQIAATTGASCSVKVKPGTATAARWQKSCTATFCAAIARVMAPSAPPSGSGSGKG